MAQGGAPGGGVVSELLLTTAQAAKQFGFSSRKAFDQAVVRLGLPFEWFGRRKRFRVSQVERAIRAFSQRHEASR